MSRRERMLAAVVGVAGVFMVLMYGLSTITSGYQRRSAERRGLLSRIDNSELEAQRGLRLADRLQEIADRSVRPGGIPSPAYGAWLMELADRQLGLSNVSVRNGGTSPVRLAPGSVPAGTDSGPGANIAFHVHKFELNGTGDLEQISDLAFALHTADINHRLTMWRIAPVTNTKTFNISLTLEVVAMETAPERSRLEMPHQELLAGQSREALKESILGRNIFGPENLPPDLQVQSRYTAYLNQPFSLLLEASDPDELDTVRFEADLDDLERARFSAGDGRIEWTPQELGEYRIRVAAIDDAFPRGRTEKQVTIRVENAPAREVRVEVPRPTFPIAKLIYVSGITEISGEKRVWLDVRTEGRTLQLGVGDSFQLGNFEAAIASIDEQRVEIDAGGRRVSVGLGKSLADSGL
jgi:hypothetical protein